jgi:hypothetical protein
MTQAQVLQRLRGIQANGVHLGNMTGAINELLEAVIYLVEHTPEAKK